MRAIARVPARVGTKLLVAFIGTILLLVALSWLGLSVLSESDQRAVALSDLEKRASVYSRLDSWDTAYNNDFANRDPAFNYVSPGASNWNAIGIYDAALVQDVAFYTQELNIAAGRHFGATAAEAAELSRLHGGALALTAATAQMAAYDGRHEGDQSRAVAANAVNDGLNQIDTATLDNLVTSEREVLLAGANADAYGTSQHLFIAAGAGFALLAALLGVMFSWSLVWPIRTISDGLEAVAEGDFTRRVSVPNRDELGTLAASVNRMAERLGNLYRELAAANKHKSDFLAAMSHELRTPLNAVIGFADVLAERHFGDLNEKQLDYVSDIGSSGRHLLSLINDILDLAKIEAGRMELQLGDVRVDELLTNSLVLMRDRAVRQGLSLKLEADSNLGIIQADERRLKQVLFNLLTNAVKFTPAGGHIAVRAGLDGDDLVVAVVDDGVGIAEADQERVFEEFEQVGDSNAQEGTGLGLALSRRIVRLHGGDLTLQSSPGHGSAFTFRVPRIHTAVTAEAEDPRTLAAVEVPG